MTEPKEITTYSFEVVKKKGESRLYESDIIPDEDYTLAGRIFADHFRDSDKEIFSVLLLDENRKIIGINDISVGSSTRSIAEPKEIFKIALAAKAKYIIAGHNHPSGDLSPSKSDEITSYQLKRCGDFLGIQVLNSLITGIDGIPEYTEIIT